MSAVLTDQAGGVEDVVLCLECGEPLAANSDHAVCLDCRSPRGKLSEIDIAVRGGGDNPERIQEWPEIRYFLIERYGLGLSDEQLWERFVGELQFKLRIPREQLLKWPFHRVVDHLADQTSAALISKPQFHEHFSNHPGKYLVCVRFWPGFTDKFPYREFLDLPNNVDASLKLLRQAVAKEVWKNHDRILANRIMQKKRSIEALKAQAMQVRGPYRSSRPKKCRSLRSILYGKRDDWFLRLARQVGWHLGRGCPVYEKGVGPAYFFSPPLYLIAVEDSVLAKSIVDDLADIKSDSSSSERELYSALNPRFYFLDSQSISKGALVSALTFITSIRKGRTNHFWDRSASKLLERIDAFVDSWDTIADQSTLRPNETVQSSQLRTENPNLTPTANSTEAAQSEKLDTSKVQGNLCENTVGKTSNVPSRDKRSTQSGEASTKISAALIEHHQYHEGSCLNSDPIQVNKFAKKCGVASGSVTGFFKKQFGGRQNYLRACGDKTSLVNALRIINGEVTPKILFGSRGDLINDLAEQ